MHKRLPLWLGTVALLAVVVLFAVPGSRSVLLGLLRSEPFEDNRPLSYWTGALKDPDPDTRRGAAFALSRIGRDAGPAVPALAEALKDESPRVRFEAAFALYKIGPGARDAVPALCAALKDEEPLVRMDAALALSEVGPDACDAIPALIEAIKDPDNRRRAVTFPQTIRGEAIIAVGRIGPDARDALPVLREALDDEDWITRRAAAEALGKIDPEHAPPLEDP
jgi:HEAT repeat protein